MASDETPKTPFRLRRLEADEDLSGKRCKVLHLIRHAQGEHNRAVAESGDEECYKSWEWFDSRLTPLGVEQATALAPKLRAYRFSVVLVSPLSRAIQTARLAVGEGPRYEVFELARERVGTHPCDKRRPRTELAADFPFVDFAPLDTEEDAVWTEAREPMEDLIERCRGAVRAIHARPETHVALVTHNDFLTALLHDAPDFLAVAPDLRVRFGNADHHATVLEWD